jgi:hypothetical protein
VQVFCTGQLGKNDFTNKKKKMKKLMIGLLLLASINIQAQIKIGDIKGDYCEFLTLGKPLAMNSKEFIVGYVENTMQKILDDDGKDLFIEKGSSVPILNLFSAKGWELFTTYETNRGGSLVRIYLLRRKK